VNRQDDARNIAPIPERTRPILVPELIHVLPLPCFSLSIQSVIAVPYGGEANPVLAPANKTPNPSTHTSGDTPIMINPMIARDPAIRIMTRGPLSTVKTVERTIAKQ